MCCKNLIYFYQMKKDSESNREVVTILRNIHEAIVEGNTYASRTATNTKYIRRDVSGIREGRTGANARQREDPLTPAERRQVDSVKRRYYEKRKENPHYSLLSVSRDVRREDLKKGIAGGYKDDMALNHRASVEIKREDAGLPPF